MKKEFKIENLLDNRQFIEFANRRAAQEISREENHLYDTLYDELCSKFEEDDSFVVPMVEYLSCRLHRAKLDPNPKRRDRGVWWVWTQTKLQGNYVYVFMDQYAPLLNELDATVLPILQREYMNMLKYNKKKH